jgi:hypothetical protein
MIPDNEFQKIYNHETYMNGKPLGVKILIACGREPTEVERNIAWKAGELVFNEVWKQQTLSDPESQANAAQEKQEILGLFGTNNLYVEEIPNGYCNSPCCCNKPWFIVTTSIGRIKIGWRKRVLAIDWSDSKQKKYANDLFPNENVTKGEHDIHAWGYEKAKEYIQILLKG